MEPKQCNELKLKERIQVLHIVESEYSVPQTSKKFDVHPRNGKRIFVQKNERPDMESQGAPVDVARVLNGRYPNVEPDI